MLSIVTFNPIKHHLGYIRTYIHDYQNNLSALKKSLLMVGNAQMDLYTGTLVVEQIEAEILYLLHKLNYTERTAYLQWLHQQRSYQTVTLSDESVWVLREGMQEERYIHIHPGRHSPHTIRVKASTLKTAIATLCVAKKAQQPIDLLLINAVRKKVLDLSPLKRLSQDEGVEKLFLLLKIAFPDGTDI